MILYSVYVPIPIYIWWYWWWYYPYLSILYYYYCLYCIHYYWSPIFYDDDDDIIILWYYDDDTWYHAMYWWWWWYYYCIVPCVLLLMMPYLDTNACDRPWPKSIHWCMYVCVYVKYCVLLLLCVWWWWWLFFFIDDMWYWYIYYYYIYDWYYYWWQWWYVYYDTYIYTIIDDIIPYLHPYIDNALCILDWWWLCVYTDYNALTIVLMMTMWLYHCDGTHYYYVLYSRPFIPHYLLPTLLLFSSCPIHVCLICLIPLFLHYCVYYSNSFWLTDGYCIYLHYSSQVNRWALFIVEIWCHCPSTTISGGGKFHCGGWPFYPSSLPLLLFYCYYYCDIIIDPIIDCDGVLLI